MTIHELRRLNIQKRKEEEKKDDSLKMNNIWETKILLVLKKKIERIKKDYIEGNLASSLGVILSEEEINFVLKDDISEEIEGKVVRYLQKELDVRSKVTEIRGMLWLTGLKGEKKYKLSITIVFKEIYQKDNYDE